MQTVLTNDPYIMSPHRHNVGPKSKLARVLAEPGTQCRRLRGVPASREEGWRHMWRSAAAHTPASSPGARRAAAWLPVHAPAQAFGGAAQAERAPRQACNAASHRLHSSMLGSGSSPTCLSPVSNTCGRAARAAGSGRVTGGAGGGAAGGPPERQQLSTHARAQLCTRRTISPRGATPATAARLPGTRPPAGT